MVVRDITKHLGKLPLFPLPGAVLFPTMRMPLHIFEPRYRRMVKDAVEQGMPLVIGNVNETQAPSRTAVPVHEIVGVGVIENLKELPDGRFLLELVGQARVRILEEHTSPLPYRLIRGELISDEEYESRSAERASQTLTSLLGLLQKNQPQIHNTLTEVISHCQTLGERADAIAGLVQTDAQIRQAWLEELNPVARLTAVMDALSSLVAESHRSSGLAN